MPCYIRNVMKRILTLALSVCMLLSVLTVAIFADDAVTFEADTFYAAKGTAVIDGVMDDAYLKAPEFGIEGGIPRDSQRKTREVVKARVLWDENNLYIFFNITDSYITPAEHEAAWTNNYTELWNFYLGDAIAVSVNTTGQQHSDFRSEPGVVGVAMYQGGVNYGMLTNEAQQLYAAAGHAPLWAGKVAADTDSDEKKNEIKAAKTVVENCIYKTALVKDADGKVTGWTCEMQIRFENFTATADTEIGFVVQVDCDDKAAQKDNGSWGTREYSLDSNSRANEQGQKNCYQNTNYFDKLVLQVEPKLTPTPADTEGQTTAEKPTDEKPTEEQPTKEQQTEAKTEAKNETKTEAKAEAETITNEKEKGGCSSSVAELAFLPIVLAGFVLVKKKKSK